MTRIETCRVLGIMSGSSLDGIDLALCRFEEKGGHIKWEIEKAQTIPFDSEWSQRLRSMPNSSSRELASAHFAFGHFLGRMAKSFLGDDKPDLIASHGHTIFHYPDSGMTCQIGHGAAIAAETGITTVCDLRSGDVAMGGQGAPITALFDRIAFGEYDLLLNLGGICNLTINSPGQGFSAFDICPCNQLLNHLAGQAGMPYDRDGLLGRKGAVDQKMLYILSQDPYLQKDPPKTLDNTYVRDLYIQKLDANETEIAHKLSTATHFIAGNIARAIEKHFMADTLIPTMMVTGGGAHNTFLMETIRAYVKGVEVLIPDNLIVDFKESLMIAYLGFLRLKKQINVLSAVTGASGDSVSGALYYQSKN